MWLNERARQTGGAGYECAGVTLGGSQVETVASAHLRETPVYAPYGYAANVPAGAQVLLLSGGEDGAVVAGARMGNADLAPGEVELRGPGGAVVRLCRDGTVRINGLVINEKGEIEPGSMQWKTAIMRLRIMSLGAWTHRRIWCSLCACC